MSEPLRLAPRTVFARDYRIVRPLSEGGMGAVYVAEQLSTGKLRALKVMLPRLLRDERSRERFVQEARIAAKIDSDHVVEILGAGVDDVSQMPWLVMELLRGETAAEAVARRGPMPWLTARAFFEQLGHAMTAAHSAGLVHRDLKPENLFVCVPKRQGVPFNVKVLDFGIAKLIDESRTSVIATSAIGSPLWMAPEQTRADGALRPATDVWALGLLGFYVLTGRSYWLAGNHENAGVEAVLREMLFDPLVPASERAAALGRPGAIPPGFDAWFAQCVVRDPVDRFASAGPATQALLSVFDALPPAATSSGEEDPATAAWVARESDFASLQSTAPAMPETERVDGLAPAPLSDGALSNGERAWPAEFRTVDPAAGESAPQRGLRRISTALVAGSALAIALGVGIALRGRSRRPDAPAPGRDSFELPVAAPPPAARTTGCPAGMALVPGGTFTMGDAEGNFNERPPHPVAVAGFCMDRTEVTVAAYEGCVRRGGECLPARSGEECNTNRSGYGNHPINCVNWFQADAYCRSQGYRLPTEAEWEYAARGSEGRTYPWGAAPPTSRLLNACGAECVEEGARRGMNWRAMFTEADGYAQTAPVGTFPAGATPQGIQDLEGNVREWVADVLAPYDDAPRVLSASGPGDARDRVQRGTNYWNMDASLARASQRNSMPPRREGSLIGFRCARDQHALR